MVAQSDDGNDPQRAVGASVSPTVEAVAVALEAAAGWPWAHAAEFREGGLVADPLGVVAGGDEKLAGELAAHPEDLEKLWCYMLHEGLDLTT